MRTKTLSQRQMNILATISLLEIATRSQLQTLFNLGGVRNANRVLKSLEDYTRTLFVGENAYYLNKRGEAITDAKTVFRSIDKATHSLMRTDAYIYFKPTEWYSEREFTVRKKTIMPDAFFYSGSSHKFLEVDNEQRMRINARKFEEYAKMKETGAFQRKYGKFPTLIWVVKYKSRIPKLKKLAEEFDVFSEVYYHGEIKL